MSFIHPLFLIAVIGVSVPIIIHLTRNFRAKKVQFSSLMFLRATPKELIRKRRLRDLILLILRSLIFALLAVAFARPFFQKEKIQILTGKNERSIVLAIDQSYSMRYDNLFDQVKNKAIEIIDHLNGSDELSIISFSDMAKQITFLDAGLSMHKNSITQLKPNFRTTNFYRPIQLAEEILENAKNPEKQIILLSDFQDVGFSQQLSNWKLRSNIIFIPIKIAAENTQNSFMRQFSLRKSRAGKNMQVELKAEIGFTKNEKEKEINLWVNHKPVDQKTINLDQINQAFFQQYEIKEGNYQGYIVLENDNLETDNYHYFTYNVQGLPEILCIDNSNDKNSPAFFLKSAFDLGDASAYKFSVQKNNFINSKNLSKYQLLILTDLSSLTQNQINLLQAYINNGGNVILSFSENADLKKNSGVFVKMGVGKIVNSRENSTHELESNFIAQVNFKHPIFSVFVESGAAEIYRPKFRKLMTIEPDSNSSVLAKYNSEIPFLLETNLGRGKILTYTSTLNTSWTDFPIYEIYVPFVYQLTNYLIAKSDQRNSFLVGETVILEGDPDAEWRIENPENKIEFVKADETGFGRFTNTELPGNYIAQSNNGKFYFSVNIDVRESNLDGRDVQEVKAAFVKPNNVGPLETTNTFSDIPADDEKKQKLWLYLILVVLAIFMVESYYANKDYKITKNKSQNSNNIQ